MATTVRRNFKNFVYNYSEAQVKVREATSNDPWGPSSTLMTQIAEMTNNVVAFGEIMQMIWRRINDHGKNWRHVYKALVLLDYLVKTGHDKVAQQCKENIYAIETLTTFQYWEAEKDQGKNVRERAKQLVALLKDDDRLKNERQKAMKARDRMRHNYGSHGELGDDYSTGQPPRPSSANSVPYRDGTGEGFPPGTTSAIPRPSGGLQPSSHSHSGLTGSLSTYELGRESSAGAGYGPPMPRGAAGGTGRKMSTEIEVARPQTAGEEELQLQLALALSKEEHDKDVKKKQGDDLRLEMAIEQSQVEYRRRAGSVPSLVDVTSDHQRAAYGWAVSGQSNDPWAASGPSLSNQTTPMKSSEAAGYGDPFSPAASLGAVAAGGPSSSDPWSTTPAASSTKPVSSASNDPWGGVSSSSPPPSQPSGSANQYAAASADPWAATSTQPAVAPAATSSDPWASPAKPGQVSRSQGVSPVGHIESNQPGFPSGNKSLLDAGGSDFMTATQPAQQPSLVGMSGSFEHLSLGTSNGMGSGANPQPPRPKTAQDFLGDNARLVNLDQLVPSQGIKSSNPFALTTGQPQTANPFSSQTTQNNKMAMGKLAQQDIPSMNYAPMGGMLQPSPAAATSADAYGPVNGSMRPPANATTNPFLA